MRKVVVAGIGSTPFGRHPDTPIETLAVRAADAAIKETGLPRSEIGAVYLGNFVSGPLVGQEVLAGLVGDGLGLGHWLGRRLLQRLAGGRRSGRLPCRWL